MAKSKKAKLIKECRDLGYTFSAKATIAELQSIIDNNSSEGFVVRLLKPSTRFSDHPVTHLEMGETYWLPNNTVTKKIIDSHIVLILKTCYLSECPNNVQVMDITEGLNYGGHTSPN